MGRMSAGELRRDLSARGLSWPRDGDARPESSAGRTPNLVFAPDGEGGHGNFLAASYRRIASDPEWARRLTKAYTGARHLPRRADRRRGELECASSSDALLMNVFCYPGLLRRRGLCALLGVEPGLRPAFGVRAELPMRRGEVDRTELDMRLGETLAEAKLTETGFGRASGDRLLRYEGLEEVFALESLPRSGTVFTGYQVVRGILAALRSEGRYLVLLDARRADLMEICFRVLNAVHRAEVRQRLRLCSWQEIASVVPSSVADFLAEKYGIEG